MLGDFVSTLRLLEFLAWPVWSWAGRATMLLLIGSATLAAVGSISWLVPLGGLLAAYCVFLVESARRDGESFHLRR
jgi:hypothetical protein